MLLKTRRTGRDKCNLPIEMDVEKKTGSKPVVNLAYFHQIASLVKVLFKMARPNQLMVIILVYIWQPRRSRPWHIFRPGSFPLWAGRRFASQRQHPLRQRIRRSRNRLAYRPHTVLRWQRSFTRIWSFACGGVESCLDSLDRRGFFGSARLVLGDNEPGCACGFIVGCFLGLDVFPATHDPGLARLG